MAVDNRALRPLTIWRRRGHSLPHEVPPNMRWQVTTGDPLHRRVVVIAYPHGGDERLREAYKPGVAIVLAGAGLAGRECARIGLAPGSALDY